MSKSCFLLVKDYFMSIMEQTSYGKIFSEHTFACAYRSVGYAANVMILKL